MHQKSPQIRFLYTPKHCDELKSVPLSAPPPLSPPKSIRPSLSAVLSPLAFSLLAFSLRLRASRTAVCANKQPRPPSSGAPKAFSCARPLLRGLNPLDLASRLRLRSSPAAFVETWRTAAAEERRRATMMSVNE
mmetsp:Transcript_12036/g.21424  ORF Transcript_12036/g.21424 Transcript_12036/m.21424 type:complete len:134 (-) Transcript_12036:216-617(-)